MSNQISILGNLQNGILVMNQNPIVFPTNPKIGSMIINNLDLFAYITVADITNWYPLVQRNLNPSNYSGTQTLISTTWIVQHNLGTTNYYYQVQDANGNTLTPLQLIPVDNNSFKLIFNTPCAGNVLVISTANLFIDQLAIGDGTNVQITRADYEQLNFVAGNGISINFDNASKDIIISSTSLDTITTLNATASQLADNIVNEVSRAESTEITLATNISSNLALINTEVTRALSAEDKLTNSFNNIASNINTLVNNTTNTLPLTFGNVTSSSIVITSNIPNQELDTFLINTYRTAKYIIQISQGSLFQALELICMHDGINAYIMEINDLLIGSTFLATFDAIITNGNFQLLVSPLLNGLTINIVRTLIVV